jgi:hypothetical protein
MAELAFLGAIISAITTLGKMIYDEIKKAHDETKETILLVMRTDMCMPRFPDDDYEIC